MTCVKKEDCEKSWGKDICLAKKDILGKTLSDRIKTRIMWSLIVFLAVWATGSLWKTLDVAMSFAEDKAVIRADIKANTVKAEHIETEHKALNETVGNIEKDVGEIKNFVGQQTQILRALAREHGLDVDIR